MTERPTEQVMANNPRADSAATDDADRAHPAGVTADDRLWMPVETLAVLNWLGERGVNGVDDRISHIAEEEVTVQTDHVTVNYAGPATIPAQFSVEDRAGARVQVEEPLTGKLVVLFPTKSANRAASLMLQKALDDGESLVTTEMGRDALTELCNMMANGFVDQWATVFDQNLDTGPPVAVQNPELTLLQRVVSDSEVGVFLTSRIRLPDQQITADIFVVPQAVEFITKLSQVDPSVIDR